MIKSLFDILVIDIWPQWAILTLVFYMAISERRRRG